MAKNKGVCAICGKGGRLSFEHVPPKAAYNEPGTKMYGIQDWLDRDEAGDMTGGHPQPKGTGLVSICKKCNEDSGAWYVPEFAKLVRAGIQLHQRLPPPEEADDSVEPKVATVTIGQARPLPLLKEIVAMLLAVNGPEFGQRNPSLVAFVLEKESRGLPARYKLFLTLFRGPFARFAGLSVHADLETGGRTLLTEVAYPPFAYLMTIDSQPMIPVGEITGWADYAYDEVRDVTLDLLVGFGHTPLPGDYRSKAAVEADRAANG